MSAPAASETTAGSAEDLSAASMARAEDSVGVWPRVGLRGVANLVALAAAFAAFSLWTQGHGRQQIWVALIYLALGIVVDFVKDDGRMSASGELSLALRSAALTFATVAAVTFLLGLPTSRVFLGLTVLIAPVVRTVLGRAMQRVRHTVSTRRILCIAALDRMDELRSALLTSAGRQARLVGDRPLLRALRQSADDGSLTDEMLGECACRLNADTVVVDVGYLQNPTVQAALVSLSERGIRIRTYSALFEELFGRVHARSLQAHWFLHFDLRSAHHRGYRLVRTLIDRTGAGLALLVLAVVGPPTALLIRLTMGRPIFFRQRRVGEHGKEFEILKFRTMVEGPDVLGPQLGYSDPRVTPVGRVLRKLRIDELPQAWNIAKGDMSLIGPRPEWCELVNMYRPAIPLYDLRHAVKPGVTGWAQIRHGHGASIDHATDKLEYDLYYVKYQSFALDLHILWQTLRVLVCGAGR